MFWGGGSVIHKLTTFYTAIVVFTFAMLLNGCMQSVSKKQQGSVMESADSEADFKTIDPEKELQASQAAIELAVEAEVVEPQVESVWSHIQSSESLDDPSHKTVQKQIKKLTDNQRFFDVMSVRAEPYLYHITQEIEKRNMPLFLALLPMIESGFRTTVTSSWQAAGLWQIIPSTGKHLGLKQNWWYDGRNDPIASTRAALDYLQQLHDRFEDWPLALAAYNSGGATVSKAIKKNVRLGRPTDYWSLDLPPETRLYVPKLLALHHVVTSPSEFGVELPEILNEAKVVQVETHGQLQLKKAADLANVDIEEIIVLNSGFKRWATDPEGPHKLLLPAESAERFEFALTTLPQEERVTWQQHKITSGESLWTIAKKYEISIALLKKTNHLESSNLRIGRHLLIPAGSFRESVVPTAPATAIKMPVLKGDKYRIKSGDSLWLIARRFDIHVKQILEWNDISKDQAINPGNELKILLEKPSLEASNL